MMDVNATREKLKDLDEVAAHATAYGTEKECWDANKVAIKATSETAKEALDEVERLQNHIVDLNKMVGQLEQDQRWVPVDEGLPEDTGLVLAYLSCGIYEISYMNRRKWLDDGVTHWMPLPEKPEGESE